MSKKRSADSSKRLRLNDFDRFIDFSIGSMNISTDTPQNETIAESLVHRGELLLLQGDEKGTQFFDFAAKLSPSNPKHFYQMGLALFEYGSNEGKEKTLLLACKRFKKATKLDPHFFGSWQMWGSALFLLGKTFNEHHYFLEAKDKYKKALGKSKNQTPDALADFHWEYGRLWTELALHSEEALDWHLAIKSFEIASTSQENLTASFWQDFGFACMQIGNCVNDTGFTLKAIDCYKNAVSIELSSYDAWFLLSEALTDLYQSTHDEDHFTQANECFTTAAQLGPHKIQLWLNWASILVDSGRRLKDTKRLRSAIEKCHRATICSPGNAEVTAIWSEALAALGLITDRIELIYRGQDKITEVIDSGEKAPGLFHAYGMCLFSLGQYYNEIDYYFQAIERFQEGLSINRSSPKLWHALGLTYTITGNIEGDAANFEKACRFYQRAIHLESSSVYFYDYAYALSKLGEITHHQRTLELAIAYFERALAMQKNAIYLHPNWLFEYALTLDMLGDFVEEDHYYVKSLEILNHVLMVDPEYPEIHYRLALTYGHLGELICEIDPFHRALHHFRLATLRDEENDQIILDWGLTLVHLADIYRHSEEAQPCFREAEHKIVQAARLGNVQSYYHLGCLYSLSGEFDKALRFIQKSYEFEALPHIEELYEDDWLDDLRETAGFKEFISAIESNSKMQEEH